MFAMSASATSIGWSSSVGGPGCIRMRSRSVSAAPRRPAGRALPRSARADAAIIDGKAIAADVREEVRAKVAEMKEKHGKVPGEASASMKWRSQPGGRVTAVVMI